ncbi:lytic transglycosylase domain-containing protein [Novosphingobium sp. MMS21-SN21R]|uniref:lytic transglycosylase domain-containing protein n=1 Tax=Novosphingobium sp. MMS21-SN21R TaxID=2969298 RepID=UPI0028848EAF|nr:lytic transglycosylase domain-containing protein [Novosphingobium sp. MMS21-SN21R]MDT0506871.1 lytic transglycosylase domain-containing protein [Novosphingobium sp. MMS21-SN21R]
MSSYDLSGFPNAPAASGGSGATVRGAIAGAAQATGVDFGYLMAQARLESSLDPSARARTSSASGLYQFTGDTWLRTLDKHGADHGLGWASDMIEGGSVRDPAARAQLLAMRFDPQVAALMAGELANDNSAYLSGVLGRQPDHGELYLAHFFGADGAGKFLTALSNDPSQSAASILPAAAASNRSTFYGAGGAARSVGEVMALIRTRMAGAADGGTGEEALQWAASMGVTPATAQAQFTGGPIAREFQSAAAGTGNPVPVAAASMADTLRQTFSLNDGGSAPAHVRQAYGRLSALGL